MRGEKTTFDTSTGAGSRLPGRPSGGAARAEAVRKAVQHVRGALPSELGPLVRAALGQLPILLESKVDEGAGAVPAAVSSAFAAALVDLHTKEGFVRNKPAAVDERNGELLRKVSFSQNADGSVRLTGEASGPAHGLTVLIDGLGLDRSQLPPRVADVIREASTSRRFHNLGQPSTWQKVAGEALLAFLTTPGSPHLRGAAAILSGALALVGAVTDPGGSAPAPSRDDGVQRSPPSNGLERRAGLLSGQGSLHNATNVRAALLSSRAGPSEEDALARGTR